MVWNGKDQYDSFSLLKRHHIDQRYFLAWNYIPSGKSISGSLLERLLVRDSLRDLLP